MTNYEKFKDEIIELLADEAVLAVVNNEIVRCDDIKGCNGCEFDSEFMDCQMKRENWLNAEYVEPKPKHKLTKFERAFCEMTNFNYIFRAKNGSLFGTHDLPIKRESHWEGFCKIVDLSFLDVRFPFITNDDKAAWAIADLLELEVEDD